MIFFPFLFCVSSWIRKPVKTCDEAAVSAGGSDSDSQEEGGGEGGSASGGGGGGGGGDGPAVVPSSKGTTPSLPLNLAPSPQLSLAEFLQNE